jgi:hypothetical protein
MTMKSARLLLALTLLAIGLNAGADDGAKASKVSNEVASIETLNVLRVSPCKTNGDGTYVEMITTMASVLPPAEADALLARYCEECFRRKFSLSQTR